MDFVPVIEKLANEKTCIVGIGNDLMLDDGVGPYLAEEIKREFKAGNITVVNAESVLENYIFKIAESDCKNVIIVDAVNMEGEAGSVIFGPINEFREIIDNYSTHKLSLFLSAKVLEEYNKKVWLLGIKVRETGYGTGLSDKVKRSADIIRDLLLSCINRDQKELVYEH